jgi:hypothetical protein
MRILNNFNLHQLNITLKLSKIKFQRFFFIDFNQNLIKSFNEIHLIFVLRRIVFLINLIKKFYFRKNL